MAHFELGPNTPPQITEENNYFSGTRPMGGYTGPRTDANVLTPTNMIEVGGPLHNGNRSKEQEPVVKSYREPSRGEAGYWQQTTQQQHLSNGSLLADPKVGEPTRQDTVFEDETPLLGIWQETAQQQQQSNAGGQRTPVTTPGLNEAPVIHESPYAGESIVPAYHDEAYLPVMGRLGGIALPATRPGPNEGGDLSLRGF